MLRLFTVGAVLAVLFASTFLVLKFTGLITIEDIKKILIMASQVNVFYVGIIIVVILFMDMFIAIPTLTVVTLSGYFIGPIYGAIFSILGMWMAGLSGYFICKKWGQGLLLKVYKDPEKLAEMQIIFKEYGVTTLILCRAAPILPEVTCCLSGISRIKFSTFFLFYSLGTVPYAIIASFAGSLSSIDDPLPGIIGAVSISGLLWLCWYFLIRSYNKSKKISA